jgi:hypothetical protein
MKIDIDSLPDQPELKMKTLIEEITKRVQFKEKGKTLTYSTTFEFDDVNFNNSYVNLSEGFTVLFCESGKININEIRTMRKSDLIICSTLGATYNMRSLDPSGGKIYAFI